jgi:Flp pilus assembly CpaF family ATPase
LQEEEVVKHGVEYFISYSQNKEIAKKEDAIALAKEVLQKICEEELILLDDEQKEYLAYAIYLQTFGAGFLEELLKNQEIEEIAINGIKKPVFIYLKNKGWKKTPFYIENEEYFVSLVNRLARGLGRRLTSSKPRLNAILEDGSRLHASMPPISSCELTIRKFLKDPLSPFSLINLETYPAFAVSLLSFAMHADMSIIFAGNTASGKTSSLNAMLSCVPSQERILLIEETPEISILQEHQLRLIPFEEGNIGMEQLVQDSLRMRPDRVIVGEIRTSPEAIAFLESVLSGQAKGCYGTFHAQSAHDAMMRLRMMGCMESDLASIDLIIIQKRISIYEKSKRKIGERRKLYQIAFSKATSPLNPTILFDGKNFNKKALNEIFEIFAMKSNLTKKEVISEINQRTKFFSQKFSGKFEQAYYKIQKFLFGGDFSGLE